MGKILSVILGMIAVFLGVWGLVAWWSAFVQILKGCVPALLILIGGIAVFLGIVELKDSLGLSREKTEEIKEEATETAEKKKQE